jgi:hypothetical protein
VLLALGVPVFIDVGLRAFFEGLGLLDCFHGLGFLARRPLLLDRIISGADLLPNRITLEPRILQRDVGEGTQAMPALLAVTPEAALRGFVKCSDGRLYHPVIPEKALKAHGQKRGQLKRTAAATAARQRMSSKRSEQVGDDRHDYCYDQRDDPDENSEGRVQSWFDANAVPTRNRILEPRKNLF